MSTFFRQSYISQLLRCTILGLFFLFFLSTEFNFLVSESEGKKKEKKKRINRRVFNYRFQHETISFAVFQTIHSNKAILSHETRYSFSNKIVLSEVHKNKPRETDKSVRSWRKKLILRFRVYYNTTYMSILHKHFIEWEKNEVRKISFHYDAVSQLCGETRLKSTSFRYEVCEDIKWNIYFIVGTRVGKCRYSRYRQSSYLLEIVAMLNNSHQIYIQTWTCVVIQSLELQWVHYG